MNTVVDTAMIQALDSAHYLHPFTDFKQLSSKGARVITRAEGIMYGTLKAHACWMR